MDSKYKSLNLRPTVLVEQVSQVLSDAILEGIFKGGEQLIETELQKQFGISRSPLREAFRDLEKKGLVVMVPRRGTFVRAITTKDIEENFPTRAVLEGLAAREAHGSIKPDELTEMRRIIKLMQDSTKRGNKKAYWAQHNKFHEVFINASGNELLINLIKNLRMHRMWYDFSYLYYQEEPEHSLKAHEDILSALEDKKSSLAKVEKLVRDHIEVALSRFLEYQKQFEGHESSQGTQE
jgi:DNA-binding GntR family transcriptional regulator